MEYAARNPAVRSDPGVRLRTGVRCRDRLSRAEIDAIVNNPAKPTFGNTIVALDRQGRLLSRVEGIFFNLLEADATPEMQQVAENVQPKLTELSNDISLNPQLFERVKAVYEIPAGSFRKRTRNCWRKPITVSCAAVRTFPTRTRSCTDNIRPNFRSFRSGSGATCWPPRMHLRSISRIRSRWPSFPHSSGRAWPPKPRRVASRDGP